MASSCASGRSRRAVRCRIGARMVDVTVPLLKGLAAWYLPTGSAVLPTRSSWCRSTSFTYDGFTVAATWNHELTDDEDMAQFLGVVRELARGAFLAPTTLLFMVAAWKLEGSSMFSTNFVLLDVTIPAGLIGDIRVEFDAIGLGDPCTLFVVAAVLCNCCTAGPRPA
ncbi:hypothetical protein ZWY2020_025533 [Hordeum vulgare]|nr:hypothetical protein ZWY2020_025533 [Hordeum vulgare]